MKKIISVFLAFVMCFCLFQVKAKASIPVTVKGRSEADTVKMTPGFS